MDDSTDRSTDERPARGERFWTRPWARSAALVAGGLLVGGILGGTITAYRPGNGDPSRQQRDDEELLTGETADQVTEAVLDGVYEAHISSPPTTSG